jgi:hypothetical protein
LNRHDAAPRTRRASPTPRQAFATLVTNDEYGLGALALARSLRWTKTEAQLVVLATPEGQHLDELEREGCRIVPVRQPEVSDAFRERHSREALHRAAPFNKGNKPAFHDPVDNFCKLELWKLEEYDKIVFLDADAIVVKPIDVLFKFPEFSGAPNLYEELADFHRLNSGVFVAEPSRATYESLVSALDQPGVFWRRTDQTFLETYFPDWHKLPYTFNTMQYVYFNLPSCGSGRAFASCTTNMKSPGRSRTPSGICCSLSSTFGGRLSRARRPPPTFPYVRLPCRGICVRDRRGDRRDRSGRPVHRRAPGGRTCHRARLATLDIRP